MTKTNKIKPLRIVINGSDDDDVYLVAGAVVRGLNQARALSADADHVRHCPHCRQGVAA